VFANSTTKTAMTVETRAACQQKGNTLASKLSQRLD